jgi:hypothetical protein
MVLPLIQKGMSSPKRHIELKEAEKKLLHGLYKDSPSFRARQRAECLLLSAEGMDIDPLAARFKVKRDTISAWFNRWESGERNLRDAARSGRRPRMSQEVQKKFNPS